MNSIAKIFGQTDSQNLTAAEMATLAGYAKLLCGMCGESMRTFGPNSDGPVLALQAFFRSESDMELFKGGGFDAESMDRPRDNSRQGEPDYVRQAQAGRVALWNALAGNDAAAAAEGRKKLLESAHEAVAVMESLDNEHAKTFSDLFQRQYGQAAPKAEAGLNAPGCDAAAAVQAEMKLAVKGLCAKMDGYKA